MLHAGRLFGATALSVVLAGTANAAPQPKKISKGDFPQAVLAAFQKTYPKAKIVGFDRETKDSLTFYEIESKDGKIERNILFQADGTVHETEEGIPASALPAAVKGSLKAAFANGEITKAEKTTRGSTVEYEVQINAGEKKLEVVLSSNGKVISSKEHTAEDADQKDKDGEDQSGD